MTLLVKTIKGIQYYYYQDKIAKDGETKVISTYVGRVDEEPQTLKQAQAIALTKHTINILKAESKIKETDYHFESADYSQSDLDVLEFLRWIYGAIERQVPEEDLKEYQQMFFVRYVYGTTAIEGITLNEQETAKILQTGLSVQNRPLTDELAVYNYNEVKNFMKEYKGEVTENLIKTVHRILMYGMKGDDHKPIPLGEYRRNRVTIVGLGYTPPDPETIPDRMRFLIAEYEDMKRRKIHPIEIAALFHQKFEEIHPFKDGNGRTGREILNYMLTKNGYPPIYITPSERNRYIDALEKGNMQEYRALVHFIIERIAATITYLYSKTSIYDSIMSAVSEFTENGQDVGAIKEWIENMKKYHDSKDLP